MLSPTSDLNEAAINERLAMESSFKSEKGCAYSDIKNSRSSRGNRLGFFPFSPHGGISNIVPARDGIEVDNK